MDLKISVPLSKKYNTIFQKNKDFKNIEFSILKLKKNQYFSNSKNYQIILIILSGTCSVKISKIFYKNIGKRKNVFDGKAYAIIIPNNSKFEIKSINSCEIAVVKIKSKFDGNPILITPKEIKTKNVGKKNWSRKVFDIVDSKYPIDDILIGETINPSGNWSSSPPHKHDRFRPPIEGKHKEIYFYKVFPEQGFGIQRIYTKKHFDESYTIKNNDLILIPKGYHPVVAGPGYKLYYLWILIGDNKNYFLYDDPKHKWIKDN